MHGHHFALLFNTIPFILLLGLLLVLAGRMFVTPLTGWLQGTRPDFTNAAVLSLVGGLIAFLLSLGLIFAVIISLPLLGLILVLGWVLFSRTGRQHLRWRRRRQAAVVASQPEPVPHVEPVATTVPEPVHEARPIRPVE